MKIARVKAFTIMEVTITMLIAAILMAITYTAYSIVSRSYLSFNVKNKEMTELEQLDKLLKKDFNHASLIQESENGILFRDINHTITYKFNPDFIVRTSGISDTFKVRTETVNMLFEGQPLTEGDTSATKNRLDELSFSLIVQNDSIPYHYYKQYSSVNLFQTEQNAIH